ncbi:MAG: hypothetical protein IPH05_01865 [Flavobacteriales bacterium]|jgi:hypothetical protein|nr:hypothetical protein [Flavobacteriales bacterium]MBK7113389.1 hypothetical protein [Flavobacteriales bacterium]MBP8877802.1 hypothetical protein [Flavobacteriales bacterium]MCC6910561.1 hypothetical protein [Flavobacteriales bacterium]HQW06327.1 hypothetical protein [Flavobacteriales bacterium]
MKAAKKTAATRVLAAINKKMTDISSVVSFAKMPPFGKARHEVYQVVH